MSRDTTGSTPPAGPEPRRWHEADGWHLDVRGLVPPQPLVQILQLLQGLARHETLTVHHDREPTMLYPELAQIGWAAEHIAGEPGEVRLRLTAVAAGDG
jgi:hypothetical protein